MTSVNVTTTANTVAVSEDGGTVVVTSGSGTVVVTTGDVTTETFDALLARVTALESVNYLVLQDGN